jgi:DNA topoisomerase I
MHIHRRGEKGGWTFHTSDGAPVVDPEVLEYVGSLAIPPGYRDVVIFYQKTGQPKILYQGLDSKGRLQRIYSAQHVTAAARRKYCELLNFAEQVGAITERVKVEMTSERVTREKCIAMIVRLMMVCYFRIGNAKYQELYGSFGARSILVRHLHFGDDGDESKRQYVQAEFVGKKGLMNTCRIYDPLLIKELARMIHGKGPEDAVFTYGTGTPVKAIEVNDWLKAFDPIITSKQFRTYDANVFLLIFIRAQPRPPEVLTMAARKKVILTALEEISAKLHNTPAILKKNYTQSGIIEMYINHPRRFARYFLNEKPPRQALIEYLRDYCRGYGSEKRELIEGGARGL